MVSLYNCKHDGDQFRITKFDSDFNVEASYLCDLHSCECPAGHRPKCRHREMLPKFIQRGHVGDDWFYDHDRGGWVQGASKDIEPSPDLVFEEENDTLDELEIAEMADGAEKDEALEPSLTAEDLTHGLEDVIPVTPSLTIAHEITLPADATPDEVAEAFGNLLAPAGLGQASEPLPSRGTYPHTEENCLGHVASKNDPKVCGFCGTHIDSLRPIDEVENLQQPSPSPTPTIRRRV